MAGINDSNATTDADETIIRLRGPSGNDAEVTDEGELKISSFSNISFVANNKTIGTSESIAAVGASNLANRKSLVIFNRGAQDIFYGPTGVSDTTGIPITKDEVAVLTVGENIDVYLITKTGNSTVTIQEFA